MTIFKRYEYKNECVPSTMLSSAMDRAGKDGWELKYLQIDEEKNLARMVYMREEVTNIYGEDYRDGDVYAADAGNGEVDERAL